MVKFDEFLKKAEDIVEQHRKEYVGVYYMKGGVLGTAEDLVKDATFANGWTGFRDAQEAMGSVAGNYLLPGSSLVTAPLSSKGSQGYLDTGVGKAAQIASGAAGSGVGSGFTGIPSANSIGAGWGGVGNALSSVWNSLFGAGNGITMADSALGAGATPAGTVPTPSVTPSGAGVGSSAAATAAPAAATGASDVTSGLNFSDSALGQTVGGVSGATGATTPAVGIPSGFLTDAGGAASGAGSVAPAAASGGNSILNALKSPSLSNIGTAISNNSNILAPAAGLAVSAVQGNRAVEGENQVAEQAAKLAAQGEQLGSYLQNGTLPPGQQSALTQAANSAKAAIKSRYASMGMSGSSAEAQDLANVDARMQAQGAELATNLLNTGIQESGLASGLYERLMQTNLQQDQDLGSAVSNFAAAAAGGNPRGINLNFDDLLRGGGHA